MADNINPKYLPYNSKKVAELLEEVDQTGLATEEAIRNIVKNYTPDQDDSSDDSSSSE